MKLRIFSMTAGLLVLGCLGLSAVAQKKNVVVLPFENKASLIHDKLSDYIPCYLGLLIKDRPGSTSVPLANVKNLINTNGYTWKDLLNQDIIKTIAAALNADFVISGYFTEEGKGLLVSYKIYSLSAAGLSLEEGPIGIEMKGSDPLTLSESFDQLVRIIDEIASDRISMGSVIVKTDRECSLFIDGAECGKSPVRYRLRTGEHDVKIVHRNSHEETIIHETIVLKNGETKRYDAPVFVPLSITAEEKCTVYLDGKEAGTTPFETDDTLYFGRTYKCEIAYFDGTGRKLIVFDRELDTSGPIAPIYLSAKGSITLDYPPPFKGSLWGDTFLDLPHSADGLAPGDYPVRVILEDTDGLRDWVFYDSVIHLAPFEGLKTIGTGASPFEKNYLMPFIPAAAQFHNREPVKGWLVISMLAEAALITGYSIYEYLRLDTIINNDTSGVSKNYSISQINNYYNYRKHYEFTIYGCLVALAAITVYSMTDGFLTMDLIDRSVNLSID